VFTWPFQQVANIAYVPHLLLSTLNKRLHGRFPVLFSPISFDVSRTYPHLALLLLLFHHSVTDSRHRLSCFITGDRHMIYVTRELEPCRSQCGGNMIGKLEFALYCLCFSLAATLISLAIVAPERVERSIMHILTRIVTMVAGN
jgi:hypothetical protein